jgi:Amidohydrolase
MDSQPSASIHQTKDCIQVSCLEKVEVQQPATVEGQTEAEIGRRDGRDKASGLRQRPTTNNNKHHISLDLKNNSAASTMGEENLHDLRSLVQSHPIIDNHAHNLLSADNALDYEKYPLEAITSEAQAEALEQAQHTLSHRLAVKQLSTLFACEPTWDAIKVARQNWVTTDYHGLVQKCLDGTYSLLLDDLLTDSDIQGYKWHNQFIGSESGTKRIVRIEVVASKILLDFWGPQGKNKLKEDPLTFLLEFEKRIGQAILDPNVVGFKSVICYRTGLDIKVKSSEAAFKESFQRLLHTGAPFRIADKPFNDLLVTSTLTLIQETAAELGKHSSKPIQFHTGLGDNDINLVLANPAYMQPLIAQFKNVDFVLLHSSYPYTREAGYLASVYPNVYLDLGEVYSMVSKDAEHSILRQSMELTPTSRLLWSTDGHFHPETYWLSNKQFRDTLETVSA